MDFYPWVVIAHVFFVIVAFGAHGTSAFAMFQAKRESDRARLGAVLDLSQASLGIAGAVLVLALLLGIAAAIMCGHFSRLWPWAAIGVVIVLFRCHDIDRGQSNERSPQGAWARGSRRQTWRPTAPTRR